MVFSAEIGSKFFSQRILELNYNLKEPVTMNNYEYQFLLFFSYLRHDNWRYTAKTSKDNYWITRIWIVIWNKTVGSIPKMKARAFCCAHLLVAFFFSKNRSLHITKERNLWNFTLFEMSLLTPVQRFSITHTHTHTHSKTISIMFFTVVLEPWTHQSPNEYFFLSSFFLFGSYWSRYIT